MPFHVRMEDPNAPIAGARHTLGTPRFIAREHSLDRALDDGHAISLGSFGISEWDTTSGALLRFGALDAILGVFTPLATTMDGDAWFQGAPGLFAWRRATATLERVCDLPPGNDLTLAADGSHVATSWEDVIAVFRCSDGARVASVPHPFSGSNARVGLSAGGRWVLFARDASPQSGSGWVDWVLASTDTGTRKAGSEEADSADVRLTDDGRGVRYESYGKVTVVDLDPAQPARERSLPHRPVQSGQEPIAVDPEVRCVWGCDGLRDVTSGAVRLPAPDTPLALHVTATHAWSISKTGCLIGVDLATGTRTVVELGFGGGARQSESASFSPNGAHLAMLSVGDSGRREIRVARLDAPHAATTIGSWARSDAPRSVVALEDGRVAATFRSRVEVLGGRSLDLPWPAAALAASADGRTLVVREGWLHTTGGAVLLVVDGVSSPVVDRSDLARRVEAIAVSPDGMRIALGARTHVEVIDVTTRARVRTLPVSRTVGLTFSPDGRTLAVRRADSIATLWDVPPRAP